MSKYLSENPHWFNPTDAIRSLEGLTAEFVESNGVDERGTFSVNDANPSGPDRSKVSIEVHGVTAISHGQEVAAPEKQFSPSEWQPASDQPPQTLDGMCPSRVFLNQAGLDRALRHFAQAHPDGTLQYDLSDQHG